MKTKNSNNKENDQRHATRRSRRNGPSSRRNPRVSPAQPGMEGGRYCPLSEAEMGQIDQAIRTTLATVGLSEAPPVVIETVTAHGGKLNAEGRLTFPEALFDQALAGFTRNFTLYSQQDHSQQEMSNYDLHLSGKRVHVGTGGASPQVVDMETGRYRDSTLRDLYDVARIVDSLENIHFFSRSLVARDMPNDLLLDVNTAYASLIGTTKHVCTSIAQPEHVQDIAEMCFMIAGSRASFLERPFLSLNINHVVAPLRFHQESCEVMAEAARLVIPIHANSFGQLGASSPVTLAGAAVQNIAEVLAGMIFGWLINPDAKIVFGARPMITDLRTGAMSGGSGEQALLMALTTQMAQYYDLPNSCIAGATDSKAPDAQSGYEKSLTVTLAAQTGSNMITQACGTQASLMGAAFESYVIDNDMLGGILRSISPVEITETTLATEMIREIVEGEGHFLGHEETLKRMQSDFLYPKLADRRSVQEWEEAGSRDIRAEARERTKGILASHFPGHISRELDQALRSRFDIRLPADTLLNSHA